MPPEDSPAAVTPGSAPAESVSQVGSRDEPFAFPGAEAVVQTMLVVHDTERAIAFYTRMFGAREVWRVVHVHRVGHALLRIGRSEIVVLDEFPEVGIVGPASAAIDAAVPRLVLEIDDVDAVIERATAAGATVLRRAEDQWWGVRSGVIRDPFGYRWSIYSVVEAISADEMQRRAGALGLYPPPQSGNG